MAEELDLLNRDPNGLNDHLGKVVYEEVLAEPDGIHSLDFVWNCSFKCFEFWKKFCYIIATTLCGCCIAAYWGCVFSCIAFNNIWCITPEFRTLEISMSVYRRVFTLFMTCLIEPCCVAAGSIFNAFKK